MCLGASISLARHVHTLKLLPHNARRARPLPLSFSQPGTVSYAIFRNMTTSVLPQSSVLPLVLSSINLALPSGPFDDPTTTHRASCYASSVPAEEEERLLPMFLHSSLPKSPIGFLRPKVMEKILCDHEQCGKNSMWNVFRRPDDSPWAIAFADHIADFAARSQAMSGLLRAWKDDGFFPDILKGWSNETYPVYTPQRCHPKNHTSSLAFGIERAALPLFGFVNFGCLLTAFYECPITGRTMLWIPRRSLSKNTWPGRYDCTVGGGMGLGETPSDTIIRECTEEASLSSSLVEGNLRSTGILTFMNRSPTKWILPGIYYLYELRLPSDGSIQPRTNIEDGEVDSFGLMSIEEIMRLLINGEFKPSSAMALVDFCIRRGVITPESDP